MKPLFFINDHQGVLSQLVEEMDPEDLVRSTVLLDRQTTTEFTETNREKGEQEEKSQDGDPYLQHKMKTLKKRQDAYFSVYDNISVYAPKGTILGRLSAFSEESSSQWANSYTSFLLQLTAYLSVDFVHVPTQTRSFVATIEGLEFVSEEEVTEKNVDEDVFVKDFSGKTIETDRTFSFEVEASVPESAETHVEIMSLGQGSSGQPFSLFQTEGLVDFTLFGIEATSPEELSEVYLQFKEAQFDFAVFLTDGNDTFILQEHPEALDYIYQTNTLYLSSISGNDTLILTDLEGVYVRGIYMGTDGGSHLELGAEGSYIDVIQGYGALIQLDPETAHQTNVYRFEDETPTTIVGGLGQSVTLRLTRSYMNNLLLSDRDDTLQIASSYTTFNTISLQKGDDSVDISGEGNYFHRLLLGDQGDSLTIGSNFSRYARIDAGSGNDTVEITSALNVIEALYLGSGDDTLLFPDIAPFFGPVYLEGGNDSIWSLYTGGQVQRVTTFLGGETEEGAATLTEFSTKMVLSSTLLPEDGLLNYRFSGDTFFLQFAQYQDFLEYLSNSGFSSLVQVDQLLLQIDFSDDIYLPQLSLDLPFILSEMENLAFVLEDPYLLASWFTEGNDLFRLSEHPEAKSLIATVGGTYLHTLDGNDQIVLDQADGLFFGVIDFGTPSELFVAETASLIVEDTQGIRIGTIKTDSGTGGGDQLIFRNISDLTIGNIYTYEAADSFLLENANDVTIHSIEMGGVKRGTDVISLTATNAYIGTIQDPLPETSSGGGLGFLTTSTPSNSYVFINLTDSTVDYIDLVGSTDTLILGGSSTTFGEIFIEEDGDDVVTIEGANLSIGTFTVTPTTFFGQGFSMSITGEGLSLGTLTFQDGVDTVTILGNDHTFGTVLMGAGNDRVSVTGSALFEDFQGGSGADLVELRGDNLGTTTGTSTFSMGDGSDLIVFEIGALKEPVVIDGGTGGQTLISSAHLSELQTVNTLFSTSTIDADTTGDTLLLIFQDTDEFNTFLSDNSLTQQEFEQGLAELVISGETPFELTDLGLEIEATSFEQVVVGTL